MRAMAAGLPVPPAALAGGDAGRHGRKGNGSAGTDMAGGSAKLADTSACGVKEGASGTPAPVRSGWRTVDAGAGPHARRATSERRRAWPAMLGALLAISACGADGPPVPPPRDTPVKPIEAPVDDEPQPGVVLTGSGYMGAMRRF